MKSVIYSVKMSKIYSVLIILLCLSVLTFQADAQTTRRKKSVLPVASPTPATQPTVPEIVSRAGDYPNENQIIVPQSQPSESTSAEQPTLDEKIDKFNTRLKDLNSRIKTLESTQKNEYDEKQKRLLLNLDILTRAEQRAESLRKQLYDLIEKEDAVKARLEQVDLNLRPEMIERSATFAGSLRPEEIRNQNKKSLEDEKAKINSLLTQIQTNRTNLEDNVQKADALVEKVRSKTEKEIDDALTDEKTDQN